MQGWVALGLKLPPPACRVEDVRIFMGIFALE